MTRAEPLQDALAMRWRYVRRPIYARSHTRAQAEGEVCVLARLQGPTVPFLKPPALGYRGYSVRMHPRRFKSLTHAHTVGP